MRRNVLLPILLLTLLSSAALAQLREELFIKNEPGLKRIELDVTMPAGSCRILSAPYSDALRLYSTRALEDFGDVFYEKTSKEDQLICLHLEDTKDHTSGYSVSDRFFGDENARHSDFWQVCLTKQKHYTLDLAYGIGDAFIDLSGLSIDRLKVRTSSADVNTYFHSKRENGAIMDTFSIKVGMGFINARQLNLTRSKNIIADVGFGSLLLDLAGKPLVDAHVQGSVGTGRLLVILPDDDVPTRVKVKKSFFCTMRMPSRLRRIARNVFVNAAYMEHRARPTRCDINVDVSVGFISFR